MREKKGSEQVLMAERPRQFPHLLRVGGRGSPGLPQGEDGVLGEEWQGWEWLLELQEWLKPALLSAFG